MAKTKNVLLRLDPSVAETLQAIATVENRSVSEVAREAIQSLIDQRRGDPTFQRQLEQTLGEQMKVLEQLRGEASR
jgi:predicted transcriptional regulator